MIIPKQDKPEDLLNRTLELIRTSRDQAHKQGDGDRARVLAVAVTMLQEVIAWYCYWCVRGDS